MSPILTRPVREQLDHDRVIRLLEARYKRKHDVVINPGAEQNQSVTVGSLVVFPDLVLFGGRARKLEGTVEVETGESVNPLECLAEWGVFSKLPVPLHLYVPPSSADATRRMCVAHGIPVAEIWTYHVAFDQVRFAMIHRAPEGTAPRPKAAAKSQVASKKASPKKAAPKKAAPKKAAPKKLATKKPGTKKPGTSKPAAKKAAAKKPVAKKPAAKAPAAKKPAQKKPAQKPSPRAAVRKNPAAARRR